MLICGFAYPCLLTGLSGVLFPWQANGSLLTVNGQTLGSEHVGQEFVSDCYLWSRPSAYHYMSIQKMRMAAGSIWTAVNLPVLLPAPRTMRPPIRL